MEPLVSKFCLQCVSELCLQWVSGLCLQWVSFVEFFLNTHLVEHPKWVFNQGDKPHQSGTEYR